MRRKYLLIALVIVGIIIGYIGYTLYAPSGTVPTPTATPTPTPTPVQMISFEEAVECALKGGEPKWRFSEWRWLGKFEGEPFVTPDGLVAGHVEWRVSNGTLYEAEYPSGKVRGEIERFTGVEDTEEYYVWNIILMDGSSRHVDARNGELLSISPSRVPGVLTFETAVRVVYAPQKRVGEWRVQEYKRMGDFESEPYETPDGLVKGHLLWRASNGTLYEVWLPFIRDIRGKVLYIEAPDDVEEYNVWEITTDAVPPLIYYIDARNGIIRLIGPTKPFPTKPLPSFVVHYLNVTIEEAFPTVHIQRGSSTTITIAVDRVREDVTEFAPLIYVSSEMFTAGMDEVKLVDRINNYVDGVTINLNPLNIMFSGVEKRAYAQLTINVSQSVNPSTYWFEILVPLKEGKGFGLHSLRIVVEG